MVDKRTLNDESTTKAQFLNKRAKLSQRTVESDKPEILRKQAERALKDKTADLQKLSTKDVHSLVHELQVHQIELEMQNEELRRTQSELEDSRNRYSNLYDFAPIGYFTFDKNGLIVDINLTGANILGIERSFLIKKPFSLNIAFSSRDAGGISHDINNVLTPIMLASQVLKEKFLDKESQKLLNIIEKSTQRGANLIKEVMSFARGVEGEHTALQVTHLIYEIKKIAEETFPRHIEIRIGISKDTWIISGNATQLHQVLMNLCVNARDAMQDGGILRISAENCFIENYAQIDIDARPGPYVVITVSDSGTGIPPEIIDRIFEPFFTTKEPDKGTGIGLSTVLGIVKSHNGFIKVHSEVGKETTFKIYLPAIKTVETQKVDEQQHELPSGHGELILVIDDETQIRESTRVMLEKYGYRIITANDGAEAIAVYAQSVEEVKVILMDMMMPFMDGPASIRALRKIKPQIKIIAVSGLTEKDKLKNVADYTNAFLPKPYTAERLLGTIHKVLSAK